MQSLGFEALRNLTIRHLVRYGEALVFVYLYPHNSALQWCRMRLMVPHITGNTTVSWRLAQAPTTEYINIPHYWPFVKGIHRDRWIPCCLCMETYHHVYSIQNDIYTPVPGVSSPVENRSCSESYWCCVRWVTLFSWCKSVLTGGSWLYGYNVEHNSGRWGCLWDSEAQQGSKAVYPAARAVIHALMTPPYKIIQRNGRIHSDDYSPRSPSPYGAHSTVFLWSGSIWICLAYRLIIRSHKTQSREIGFCCILIDLKFSGCLGSTAIKLVVK